MDAGVPSSPGKLSRTNPTTITFASFAGITLPTQVFVLDLLRCRCLLPLLPRFPSFLILFIGLVAFVFVYRAPVPSHLIFVLPCWGGTEWEKRVLSSARIRRRPFGISVWSRVLPLRWHACN
ncbi:hypothetical protein KSP40_PGU014513 [Platanthera guangdongensis]|uniref:Uncharacterized protein n=1 Tax=Platanthera guangdongensis TaxID=2320717 RepID=A0ABR2LMG4_9ASPA